MVKYVLKYLFLMLRETNIRKKILAMFSSYMSMLNDRIKKICNCLVIFVTSYFQKLNFLLKLKKIRLLKAVLT